MAIQNRRGPSAKFDPSKLLPGEWAVKLDTKEIYMCYAAGDVRRMATYEEMVENINEATKDVQDMFTEEVRAAIQAATTAEYQANMAATSANSAATSARNAAESANTSANNANAAALNANNAADAVTDVMDNVWESMDIIAGIGLVWYLYTTGDPGRIEQVSANEYCENSVMEVSPGEKYRITIHNDASSGGSSYTSAPNIMVATAETGGYRIVDSYVGSYQNQVVTIPESADQLYLLLYSTGRNLGGISRVEKYMISEYAKTEADANKAIQNANAVAQEIIGKVEQIDQNTQRIAELKGDLVNLTGEISYTENKVIMNGRFYDSASWKISEKLKFVEGISFHIQLWLSSDTVQMAWFDSNDNIIKTYNRTNGTVVLGAVYEFEIDKIEGADYFRFTATTNEAHINETKFYRKNVIPSILNNHNNNIKRLEEEINNIPKISSPLKGKKILVLGDSISTDSYHTPGVESWKKWASFLAEKCDFILTNDSIHATGFVNANAGDNLVTRVRNHTSSENYDMIVIFAGVNDHKGNVEFGDNTTDTSTEYGAMKDVLNYLMNTFTGARIVAFTPLQWSGKNVLFNNLNLEQWCDKMKEVYSYYSIPVLDLNRQGGFRPWNSNFNTKFGMLAQGPDGMVHDGLHPNQDWDNNYLAPQIKEFMERYIF